MCVRTVEEGEEVEQSEHGDEAHVHLLACQLALTDDGYSGR
jgi:hypothetical protein